MAPIRTCIGCRTPKPATELVRYTLDADGTIQRSRTGPGRGAWLCPDRDCIERAIKRSAFDRAFRTRVQPDQTTRLLQNHISQMRCGP